MKSLSNETGSLNYQFNSCVQYSKKLPSRQKASRRSTVGLSVQKLVIPHEMKSLTLTWKFQILRLQPHRIIFALFHLSLDAWKSTMLMNQSLLHRIQPFVETIWYCQQSRTYLLLVLLMAEDSLY